MIAKRVSLPAFVLLIGLCLSALDTTHSETTSSISVGNDVVCYILGGSLTCWGRGNTGAAGLNAPGDIGTTMTDMSNLEYIAFSDEIAAEEVSVGTDHTCALFSNLFTRCWGTHADGRTGRNINIGITGDGPNEMKDDVANGYLTTFPDGSAMFGISAGNGFSCVNVLDYGVQCFGLNDYGQLGAETTTARRAWAMTTGRRLVDITTVALNTTSYIASVHCGERHACAVTEAHEMFCWGDNSHGQLGQGTIGEVVGRNAGDITNMKPLKFNDTTAIVDFALGDSHTCVVFESGALRCFGDGFGGALGTGIPDYVSGDTYSITPVQFATTDGVIDVACGLNVTCAAFTNGKVRCWGKSAGTLGYGNSNTIGDEAGEMESLAFVPLASPEYVTSIDMKRYSVCALYESHRILCWGVNGRGQLGVGDTDIYGNDPNEVDKMGFIRLGRPSITALSPSAIPTGRSTTLTITSSPYIPVDPGFAGVDIRFGLSMQTGTYVSPTQYTTPTPVVATTGDVGVEMRADSMPFTTNGLTVYAYREPEVETVTPRSGSVHGGTNVTLTGKYFSTHSTFSVKCCFGDGVYADATYNDPITFAWCVVPSNLNVTALEEKNVTVSLALNGVDCALTGASFYLYNEQKWTFDVHKPSLGPLPGKTDIVMNTTGPKMTADPVKMRLGTWDNNGVVIIEDAVTAVENDNVLTTSYRTPHFGMLGIPGPVLLFVSHPVFLSVNDGHEYHATPFTFQIYPPETLSSSSPDTCTRNGGTEFYLTGSNLIDSPELTIEFTGPGGEKKYVIGTYDDGDVLVTTPSFQNPGSGTMRVSLNGQNYAPQSVPFNVYQVYSLSPKAGPIDESTFVTVIGEGFSDTGAALTCKFGTLSDVGYYTSPSSVRCISPQQSNGTVFVELALNSIDYTTDNQTFVYYKKPIYTDIVPTHAPSTTVPPQDIITLYGKGFLTNFGLYCKFDLDGDAIAAIPGKSNATQVACEVPTAASGQSEVPVVVSMNGQHYHESGLAFTYFTVLELTPPLGPLAGGTKVLVSGIGIPSDSSSVVCRFSLGNSTISVVPGVVKTSAAVACDSPTQALPGKYTLEISQDSVHFTNNTIEFQYYPTPTVAQISPSSGPKQGGNVVTVSGPGVNVIDESYVRCRFGLVNGDVKADNTTVLCIPKGGGFGIVDLYISLNGGFDYTAATTASEYSFYTLTAIEPTLGPTSGGTLVQVSGTNFRSTFFNSGAPLCDFGGSVVRAKRISDSTLTCVAPARGAGTVEFRVSLNGQSDGYTAATSYVYYTTPVIASFLPVSGPSSGGTAVTVAGTSFYTDAAHVYCRFGAIVTSSGKTLSSTSLTCTSPVQESKVTLSVSFNNVDFVDVGEYHAFTVNSLEPPRGPLGGGTLVRINGADMVASDGHQGRARCKFGDALVNATILSAVAVTCVTPNVTISSPLTAQAGTSNFRLATYQSTRTHLLTVSHSNQVQLSLDGVHYHSLTDTKNAQPFLFYREPVVTRISPTNGTTVGGTDVTLYGSGFLNGSLTSCKFGTTTLDTPVAATYLNDTMIVCKTPSHAIGNVSVVVSGNQQQFVGSNKKYSYDACGFGTYATVFTDPCTPCAAGSYSNSFGARECKLCDSSSFQPAEGSIECASCPTGSLAATTGNTDIINCTCPTGWYTENLARGTACLACPTGATCAGDVARPITEPGYWSSESSPFVFMECSVAAACAGGVSNECGAGYQGRLCSECQEGYYQKGDTCNACPDNAYIMLIVFIGVVIIITGLLIKSVDPENGYQYGGTIAIIVDFLQILALLSNLPIAWPQELKDVLTYLASIVSFRLDIFQLECTLPSFGWIQKWLITMGLPVLIAFNMLVVYIAAWALNVFNRMRNAEPKTTIWDDQPVMWPDLNALGDRLINSFCFVISIVYLIVIQGSFSYFACTRLPDGLSSLNAQPSLLCYDTWWYQYLPVAILALLVYGILIPLLFAWWVYHHATSLRDPLFNRRYSALYFEYRYEFSYWGTAIMVEKMAIAAVEAFCSNYSNLTLVLLLFVLFTILALGHALHPFLEVRNNLLELIVRWCMCVLLLAGMIWDASSTTSKTASLLMSIAFLTVVALCIIIAFSMVGMEIYNIRQTTQQKVDEDLQEVVATVTCPLGRTIISDWFVHLADVKHGRDLQLVLESILDHGRQMNHHLRHVNDRVARDLPAFVHVVDNYTSFVFSPYRLPIVAHWLLVRLQYITADPHGNLSFGELAASGHSGAYLNEYMDAGGEFAEEDPVYLLRAFFAVFSDLAKFQVDAPRREAMKMVPSCFQSKHDRVDLQALAASRAAVKEEALSDEDIGAKPVGDDSSSYYSEESDRSDRALTKGHRLRRESTLFNHASTTDVHDDEVHPDLVTALAALYGFDRTYSNLVSEKIMSLSGRPGAQKRAFATLHEGFYALATEDLVGTDSLWASLVDDTEIGDDLDGIDIELKPMKNKTV